jgi:hypothetical protein
MVITPWMIAIVIRELSVAKGVELLTFSGNGTDSLLMYLVLANMGLPLIITTLHGPLEGLWMARSFIQFYFFLPTMVGYFTAYSFSRIWDLSWGNRPSESLKSLADTKSTQQQADIKSGLKNTARFWCWLVVVLNLGLIVMLIVPWEAKSYVLMGVACVVFAATLIQMVTSLIWIICLNLSRLNLLWSCVFCCRCTFQARLKHQQNPRT